MSENIERKRVYTGSEVNVQHLKTLLEDAGIQTQVRNEFASGLRAGFGGGLPGQVQLFVITTDFEKAEKIVKQTFPDQ